MSNSADETTVLPALPWWRRGGKKLYAAVIALGALATAVTAVLTFRIPHDVEDAATFTGITVAAGVPFDEYRQHLVAPHAPAKGLGALDAFAALPTSSSVPAPGPAESSATTPAPEPAVTSPPDTEPDLPLFGRPSAGPSAPEPTIAVTAPSAPVPRKVLRRAQDKVQVTCGAHVSGTFCASAMRAITQMDIANGNRPDDAVAREIAMVKTLRTTRTPHGAKPEPVGVVVTAGIDLKGLRGQTVQLSWSLWEQDKNTQLYRQWLNNRLAYRMTASTDHDTAGLDFWIPLPRSHGSYVVRSQLLLGDATLADATSPPFR